MLDLKQLLIVCSALFPALYNGFLYFYQNAMIINYIIFYHIRKTKFKHFCQIYELFTENMCVLMHNTPYVFIILF